MTRINARLDPQSAADLELIRQKVGASSLTDALKYSLHQVATRMREESDPPGSVMHAFLESDYIGCADGPEDLSENYKQCLDASLRDKHDLG